jgi:hypothetical protein
MLRKAWEYISNNGLIAALLAVLLTSSGAWAWIAPARRWLSADSHLVRGAVVSLTLLLLIALAIVWRLAASLRKRKFQAAVSKLEAEPASQSAPVEPIPDGFAPTVHQERILRYLLDQYPLPMSLANAHNVVRVEEPRLTAADTEVELEGLVASHVVDDGGGWGYRLTRSGRDFARNYRRT